MSVELVFKVFKEVGRLFKFVEIVELVGFDKKEVGRVIKKFKKKGR